MNLALEMASLSMDDMVISVMEVKGSCKTVAVEEMEDVGGQLE